MKLTASRQPWAAIALLLLASSEPSHAERLPSSDLPAASTIRCSGNEQIDVAYRHIHAKAEAVQAHGNCRVRLTGMHVTADGIAVLATGNADVVIENSFVQGTQLTIKATGNAVVRYRDSTVRGEIFAAAGGRAIEAGGNTVLRLPLPVSAPLTPTASLRCEDRERVVLLHRLIDLQSNGIEVEAGCSLTLSDSHIRTRGWGLRIARGGQATVLNSVIEAGKHDIVVEDGGTLYVAGSSIPGVLQAFGDATVVDGGGNAWREAR